MRIKINPIAEGEAPDAIHLTLKGSKISIAENYPSLTDNSNVIQNTKTVAVDTLDAILIDFMNELKLYFNTEDVSYPQKSYIGFGNSDTVTEFNVFYYIGKIKNSLLD